MRVDDPGGPLADQETSVSLDHKGNETSRGGGFAFAQVRQFPDAAFAKRDAEFFTGQIWHCGFRGVQTSAPSSIRDWLRCEQQTRYRPRPSFLVLVLDLDVKRDS